MCVTTPINIDFEFLAHIGYSVKPLKQPWSNFEPRETNKNQLLAWSYLLIKKLNELFIIFSEFQIRSCRVKTIWCSAGNILYAIYLPG